jgi:hypothetical protein
MQQGTDSQDYGAIAAMQDTGFARSPIWQKVESAFLSRNPNCAACKRDKTQAKLEVHHMLPFHLCRLFQRPDLEFDPTNLMTLCDVHHLYIGHLGDWQSFNENVQLDVQDATRDPLWATLFDKQAFDADAIWVTTENGRPKPVKAWGSDFTQHFTGLLTKLHSPAPQEPLSQLVYKWYGLKVSESEITSAVNADLGTATS